MASLAQVSAERVASAQRELSELEKSAVDELAVHIGQAAAEAQVDAAFAEPAKADGPLLRQRAERAVALAALLRREADAGRHRQAFAKQGFEESLAEMRRAVALRLPALGGAAALSDAVIGAAMGPDLAVLSAEPVHSVLRWRSEAAVARRACGLEPVLDYAAPCELQSLAGSASGGADSQMLCRSGLGSPICAAATGRDTVLVGTDDGRVWQGRVARPGEDPAACAAAQPSPERAPKVHGGPVTAIVVMPDGTPVSAGDDGQVVAHVGAGGGRRLMLRLRAGVLAMTCLPDGLLALAGGRSDPSVCVVDPASGTTLRRLEGHAAPVSCILPLDCQRFATACADGVVRVFSEGDDTAADLSSHGTIVAGLVALSGGRVAVATAADDVSIIGAVVEGSADDSSSAVPSGAGNQLCDAEPDTAEPGARAAAAASPAGIEGSVDGGDAASARDTADSNGGDAASERASEGLEAAAAAPSPGAAAASVAHSPASLATPAGDQAGSSATPGAASGCAASHAASAGAAPATRRSTAVHARTMLARGTLALASLPGDVLAVAGADGSIALLQSDRLCMPGAGLLSRLPGGRGQVVAMAELADGRLLAAYESGCVVAWGFRAQTLEAWAARITPPSLPRPAACLVLGPM